ncbi:MAG: hypothetical protein JWP09_473 [Candidatus Taylorbacteria bacterium]|nr:hypothetical protein [Candidatus Taylorbacteria bacterium]
MEKYYENRIYLLFLSILIIVSGFFTRGFLSPTPKYPGDLMYTLTTKFPWILLLIGGLALIWTIFYPRKHIEVSDNSIIITKGKQKREIRWSDVEKIKRPFFAQSMISMSFEPIFLLYLKNSEIIILPTFVTKKGTNPFVLWSNGLLFSLQKRCKDTQLS